MFQFFSWSDQLSYHIPGSCLKKVFSHFTVTELLENLLTNPLPEILILTNIWHFYVTKGITIRLNFTYSDMSSALSGSKWLVVIGIIRLMRQFYSLTQTFFLLPPLYPKSFCPVSLLFSLLFALCGHFDYVISCHTLLQHRPNTLTCPSGRKHDITLFSC